MQDNQSEKRSRLARDVLRLSRNRLLVSLRFLDMSLSRLQQVETEFIRFGTDGKVLAYDPRHVLLGYKEDRALPARDYLHSVLHCVYRHNFIHTLTDHTLWDLACDIAVEYSITQLEFGAVEAERQKRQLPVFQKLQNDVKLLTAEKLYRYLLDQNLHPIRISEWQDLFGGDDHALWYMGDDEKAALGLSAGDSQDENPESANGGGSVAFYGSEEDWK